MQAFKRLRKMRNMESDQSTTSLVDSTEMISFTLQDTTPSVNAEQLELRPMRRKPRETILELLLDFFFIALSLPSLLYALSVMYYDSTPVHEHERMANLFIQISRIVRSFLNKFMQGSTDKTGTNCLASSVRCRHWENRQGIYCLAAGKRRAFG